MLLVVILYHGSNIEQDVDSLVFHLLLLVVEQVVQYLEYLLGGLVLLQLRALLLHKLDHGNELVQQGYLDLGALSSKQRETHHQAFDQPPLLYLVGEVHQTLREIELVVLIEVLDVGLNGLLTLEHVAIRASISRIVHGSRRHLLELLHPSHEASFSLYGASLPSLSLLELRINSVCFFSF